MRISIKEILSNHYGLDESPAEIRLGLGENGSPKDLERLGFDTSLYIRGSVPEDFLVFS